MPIHLLHTGPEPTPEEIAEHEARWRKILNTHIISYRDFTGVKLSPEDFQEFQEIVNERRPWCREDSRLRPAGLCGDVGEFIKRRFGRYH